MHSDSVFDLSRRDSTPPSRLGFWTLASSTDGCYGACLELPGSINRLSVLVQRDSG